MFVLLSFISMLYMVGVPAVASRLHLSVLPGLEFHSAKQDTERSHNFRSLLFKGLLPLRFSKREDDGVSFLT